MNTMNSKVFDIILLLALPASGKSETRQFMARIDPEKLAAEYHVGENVQLDDFPYVFIMRRIDEELVKLGEPRVYYPGETPFYDGRDWGTLIQLLNEDYLDLIDHAAHNGGQYPALPDGACPAAHLMFKRLEKAAAKAGISPRLAGISKEILNKVAEGIEDECYKMFKDKLWAMPQSLEGKTVIMELSRGGPDGAEMPLTGTCGYQYSLAQFCPEILERAKILYIWVTPEESRRKNEARADPNDPGSSLHHMTPVAVMMADYGCDDMLYLASQSGKPDTVSIVCTADGKVYDLPIGVFDNRDDKTTFLREEPETWPEDKIEDFGKTLKKVTDTMNGSGTTGTDCLNKQEED